MLKGKDLFRLTSWLAPLYRCKFWGIFVARNLAIGVIRFEAHKVVPRTVDVADVIGE